MSKKPLALISSDLHISQTIQRYKRVIGDSYYGFYQIVQQLNEIKPQYFMVLGDLTDTVKPTAMDIQVAQALSKQMPEDLRILTLHGEHCHVNPSWHPVMFQCVADAGRLLYADMFERIERGRIPHELCQKNRRTFYGCHSYSSLYKKYCLNR